MNRINRLIADSYTVTREENRDVCGSCGAEYYNGSYVLPGINMKTGEFPRFFLSLSGEARLKILKGIPAEQVMALGAYLIPRKMSLSETIDRLLYYGR